MPLPSPFGGGTIQGHHITTPHATQHPGGPCGMWCGDVVALNGSGFGGMLTKLRFFARSATKRTVMEWILQPLAESSKISSDDSSTMVLLLIAVFRERRTATTMSTFRSSIPFFSHLEKMQELKPFRTATRPTCLFKAGDLQENWTRLCTSTKVQTFPSDSTNF